MNSEEETPHVVERIIERAAPGNGNGGFGRFKDLVFGSIILGAGWVIWQQQSTIDDIKTHLAVLDLKCQGQPIQRGGPNDHS